MYFINFRTIKIAVGNYNSFLDVVKQHLLGKKPFLFSVLNKKRLRGFALSSRLRRITQHISLFFCEEEDLVLKCKKAVECGGIAINNTPVSSGEEAKSGKLQSIVSEAPIDKIPAHLLFQDIVGFAIKNNMRVVFLGFSLQLETNLKYNLAMLHGLQGGDTSSERSAIAKLPKFFFIHKQALILSNASEVESLLEKIAPSLVICHEKAIITFNFYEMTKKLKCCLFWLDRQTLMKATKQRILSRRKKTNYIVLLGKMLLKIPRALFLFCLFIITMLYQALVFLPKSLFMFLLLRGIGRSKVERYF